MFNKSADARYLSFSPFSSANHSRTHSNYIAIMLPHHETLINFQNLKRSHARMTKGVKRARHQFYKLSRRQRGERTASHKSSGRMQNPSSSQKLKDTKGNIQYNDYRKKIKYQLGFINRSRDSIRGGGSAAIQQIHIKGVCKIEVNERISQFIPASKDLRD